ncbi:S-layer homology domain-containing protein [Paenibacillus sp. HWE-109]|uniref:S-layer homology domain-containing protein n=1 Tax=Paenibacillus sp. HWE-109 TaxID=1306526 RepID=UPI001EE01A81|nr:S-layer homology domain-containing protein [Paenibacillus sp. HWE-109]UKS26305.1 S-layer homology domain-containing protein [Paenibacillus sp. HWE-109]
MKLSTSGLKIWFSRSGRIVLACLLALMLIPFMGAGKAAHATSPTWTAAGQSVQPSNVQTFLKVGGTLYAGTGNFNNDVWRNTNGIWTQMEGSPAGVRTFLVDAEGTLYAGSWGDGVSTYTASDGWKQMSGSPGNVYSLIDVNGTLYAGASSGINNSKDVWTYDTTATTPAWTQMTTSNTPTDVQALIHVNGKLYAGTFSNGIWAYSNGAWTPMSSTPSGSNTLTNVVSLVDVNGTLYAATFGGTHNVWTYSGGTWTPISNSPRYARTLFNMGGTLYVGTASTSDDMWTCTSTSCTHMFGSPGNIYAMLDDNGTLYAGTKNGDKDVWTYRNGAWSQMGVVPGDTNTLLSVNGTLYAGTNNDTNSVWAYTDSSGWTRMSGSPGYVYALIDVGGTLYAGTSNDDNDNDVWTYDTTAPTPAWTQMTSSHAPSNVYVLLNVGGTLYAGTNNGDHDIWTYDTAATTPEWTQMTASNMPSNVNALLNVNGTLYAGTGINDVWTYDMSATTPEWTQMTMSNVPISVHALLNVDATLYAGTFNGGNDVWTYDTNATAPEWTQMTTSHAPSDVNTLINVNGTLYAGTDNGNNDVWSYSNGTWEQVSGSPSQLHSLLEANGKLYAAGLHGVHQMTSPGAPVNLQASSTTTTSTTLSWDAVAGAKGYYLYKDGGNTAIATVTSATYMVSGLAPNSSYTFAVSAYNAAGESAKSGAIPVQTLSTAATLTSTIGTVSSGSTANESITNIPYGTTLADLKAAITPAANATFEVYDADGTTEAEVLATGKKVIVTAQDGATKVTYTVTVIVSTAATLTSTIGTVSTGGTTNESITNIPYGTTLTAFKAAITPAANATFEVYDADGTTVATALATGEKVIVTAQDGTTKVTYTVAVIPAYTVMYNGNGATSGNAPTDSGSYAQGATVSVYSNTGNLVKNGYAFAGWNTQADGNGTTYAAGATFSMGTTNVTLYAKWTANPTANPTYTVTYNGNGNSGGSAPTDSGSYAQGVTVSVYGNTGNLVKTGYTFVGWNTQADGNGTTYAAGATFSMGTTNVMLYAKWTANPTYTVTYNGNGNSGGSAPTDSSSYEQSVTVSVYGNTGNLVKTGYTFSGWNTAADGSGTNYNAGTTFSMGTTNVTLYAKWTANNTGSSSSGGGGSSASTSTSDIVTSTNGTLTLPVGKMGEVSLGDAVSISIPADASGKELKLTIEKVADTQKLLTKNDVLASPVFEILKNFPENFGKEITLTFTFDPKSMKKGQQPSVFYYDEAKKVWVKVGGTVNGNTITVKVNHFTKYAVFGEGQDSDSTADTKQVVNFSDISGHWAGATIKQAVSAGIVSGYPDGTFKPDHTVTRAEFAVMLMNVLKPQGDGSALSFTDKAKIGAWAQKSVAQAVYAGIITGYEDSTFRPDAEITRPEMAVMIAKALGQSVEATMATGFADDKDIPGWAKGAVATMKKLGIIEGKGADEFAPVNKTTRAEAVTVLLKMLAQKSK